MFVFSLRARVAVNSFDQSRHMFGRRELMDAVPQVKNMCRPRAHRVCVRLAKTVEHAQDFLLNPRWRRKQNMRVNIALQSLSGTHRASRSRY